MGKAVRLEFLIIDPQNDFCNPNGNLFVAGADADVKRLASLINRLKDKIFDIHVTLDTHRYVDVAHPIFWVNSEGKHPAPFTIITADDVANGVYMSFDPNPVTRKRAADYVKSLSANGRYPLCIWPPHCLIGTEGHNVAPDLMKELLEWEKRYAAVDYVTKGSNPFTEHYSAVQADVPDPTDASTMLNTKLIQTLQEADVIALSGQALSHCVANTVRDIANNFGEDNIKKLVLIRDTTSSVTGFEQLGEDFVKEMVTRGMQVAKSNDFFV